ncbi:type II secretion system F family protein [Rhizobium sp. CFBP 8762]|uniref:type II secretion system F family protein n=1 Tax=Rhizobium sp. CFBP 8762 TaxID=2775279 RepID=UPI0017856D37|nr:type II secretion system F family protein [Rhizobium sp. CFBP 8762]MBD8555335.1 type II secretion system F family protein [Rhizobium sp. CFBP 8762]
MPSTLWGVSLDQRLLLAVLVAVAVLGLIYVVATPFLDGNSLNRRMKSVATERERIRARERARLSAQKLTKASLRSRNNTSVQTIVERLNLRKALVDDGTLATLRTAGFRSQNALNTFLFARFTLPFVFASLAALYAVVSGTWAQSGGKSMMIVLAALALGFYLPNIYVSNVRQKRLASIRGSWPDALDLMLICVEAGVTVELAMRRVADEIAGQSPELAEELVLTTAELSFLPERRMALENLGNRVGLDNVKAVAQALIQADRFGTPVAQALRVLAQESRDMRMEAAERKAASLPPKLTVPMIIFFLPVLFVVILGPAALQIIDQFMK